MAVAKKAADQEKQKSKEARVSSGNKKLRFK